MQIVYSSKFLLIRIYYAKIPLYKSEKILVVLFGRFLLLQEYSSTAMQYNNNYKEKYNYKSKFD